MGNTLENVIFQARVGVTLATKQVVMPMVFRG